MKCFYAVVSIGTNKVSSVVEWDTTRAQRPPVSGWLIPCPSSVVPGMDWDAASASFKTPIPVPPPPAPPLDYSAVIPPSTGSAALKSAFAAVEALVAQEAAASKG